MPAGGRTQACSTAELRTRDEPDRARRTASYAGLGRAARPRTERGSQRRAGCLACTRRASGDVFARRRSERVAIHRGVRRHAGSRRRCGGTLRTNPAGLTLDHCPARRLGGIERLGGRRPDRVDVESAEGGHRRPTGLRQRSAHLRARLRALEQAFALGGAARSGLGLLAGAAVFVALETALDRHVRRQDAARSGVAGRCWRPSRSTGSPRTWRSRHRLSKAPRSHYSSRSSRRTFPRRLPERSSCAGKGVAGRP